MLDAPQFFNVNPELWFLDKTGKRGIYEF